MSCLKPLGCVEGSGRRRRRRRKEEREAGLG